MMNRRLSRWLYRKAAQALGEDELESLKNDLVNPVKIAAKEAIADLLDSVGEDGEQTDAEEDAGRRPEP